MLRGLWHLTWLELKIFLREPMGVVGTLVIPVVLYVVLARTVSGRLGANPSGPVRAVTVDLPIVAAILIALSAVLSLVTIIAIYREGGILKRLRATPLRPWTILGAHVLVKLLLMAVTIGLTVAFGGRSFAVDADVPVASFVAALLLTTVSILSLGFVIASLVPTARFAQPVGAIVLYPMLGLSGLFVPVEALPPAIQAVARLLPLTYAVSLLRGIWHDEGWLTHAGDAGMLVLILMGCVALSARVFRWE